MKTYFLRIFAWLSQGVNCIFLAGHHDMTVSARAYVEYRIFKNRKWRTPYKILNAIFCWQEDHCMESFLQDLSFAAEIKSWVKGQ